jgi:hypothetical protein
MLSLPTPIAKYLEAKGGSPDETLACFTPDAVVEDIGEDLTLTGTDEIRGWLSGTVSEYNLTSEVKSAKTEGGQTVVGVVLTGDFPGSPYEFAYRFSLRGDLIEKLSIDPIGSLAT